MSDAATGTVQQPGEPRPMAMFPLGTVLYPHAAIPLHVFEPRYRQMIQDCLEGEGEFGVVLISRGGEVGGGDERCGVGTVAHIEAASPFPDGRFALLCEGRRRIAIEEWLPEQPYPNARVRELAASTAAVDPELVAATERTVRRARALLSELGEAPALAGDLGLGDDADAASWRLCAVAPLNPYDAQRLLETDDTAARLERLRMLCVEVADDLGRLLAEGSSES
ncbi:MAG TPA: LON peptidase substrate-binding domain-containing protein [Acidimicrobiales bacterium]|nr:LON peptidase substrate-binding domain-containing protein [Acidimicrobiales bacterium]